MRVGSISMTRLCQCKHLRFALCYWSFICRLTLSITVNLYWGLRLEAWGLSMPWCSNKAAFPLKLWIDLQEFRPHKSQFHLLYGKNLGQVILNWIKNLQNEVNIQGCPLFGLIFHWKKTLTSLPWFFHTFWSIGWVRLFVPFIGLSFKNSYKSLKVTRCLFIISNHLK